MRIFRKFLLIIGILSLLATVFIASASLYYYTKGKTYAIKIPLTDFIIRLGKVPESSIPKTVDSSFKKEVTPDGYIINTPIYVDNAIVDSELNGDIYAHNIRTGERNLYYWQDETAYVCIDTRNTKPLADSQEIRNTDPAKTLENYHFFFSEYGKRGDQLLSGLSHFESDVEPGMPIQLLLKNRTKNEDGAYDLVGIILFIEKECSTYPV